MPRTTNRGKPEANRAAIYARVSDKSQDEEEKTSISEQMGDMEAYCVKGGVIMDRRGGCERPGVALQNWTTRRLL